MSVSTTVSADLFRFAQLEYPWLLGPDDGRYVVRRAGQEAIERVVVVETRGARERRSWLRGGRRTRPGAEPSLVPVTVVTVVDTEPMAGDEQARAWLRSERSHDGDAMLATGLEAVNDALRAHRLAIADPFLNEVAIEQATAARIGYGRGSAVANGQWAEAFETPRRARRRQRRSAALRPQERLGALLGARDPALAAEELTLRARLDHDRGRRREAALQLSIALRAALVELEPWVADRPALAKRLQELRGLHEGVEATAEGALLGGVDDQAAEVVQQALERLEAALRARTAPGVG